MQSLLIATLTLLLAAAPAPIEPAAAPVAVGTTAEVRAVKPPEARRDPLQSFLNRIDRMVKDAATKPMTPQKKDTLLRALDDKLRRARSRKDYLRRRLSELQREISEFEAFEGRADGLRRALEAAPTAAPKDSARPDRKK